MYRVLRFWFDWQPIACSEQIVRLEINDFNKRSFNFTEIHVHKLYAHFTPRLISVYMD